MSRHKRCNIEKMKSASSQEKAQVVKTVLLASEGRDHQRLRGQAHAIVPVGLSEDAGELPWSTKQGHLLIAQQD